MNLTEIEARRLEIVELLKGDGELEPLKEELRTLDEQEAELRAQMKEAEEAEERRLAEEAEEKRIKEETEAEERRIAEAKEKMNAGAGREITEEKKMTFNASSPEYRNVWAKRMMGQELTPEERAVGDAVFTTSATYTGADVSHVGVNNAGLLIPTSVRTDILNIIEEMSPFFRDIRKLAIKGNIDLPYMYASDDAAWVSEGTDTANEGMEFRRVQLVGYELAKQVEVTWLAREMAVEDFIPFLEKEIAIKMSRALINAIIYGNGSSKATGAIYGLSAETGVDPIAAIKAAYDSLDREFQIGAKVYISNKIQSDILFYQDDYGKYEYVDGLPKPAGLVIEVEPNLTAGDIMVGNPANYILNTTTPLEINQDVDVKARKDIYAAYMVADGKPYPGAFAKGQVSEVSA